MLNIAIAEDNALWFDMIKENLLPGLDLPYTITHELSTVTDLECFDGQTDLILFDLIYNRKDCSPFIAKWEKEYPHLKVLINSSYINFTNFQLCLHRNVFGFLYKGDPIADLIIQASKGIMAISPNIREEVFEALEHAEAPDFFTLSQREMVVLKMVSLGMENHEIAEATARSIKTIQAQRSSALHKSGAKNMIHLISLAKDRGLI